MPDRTAPDRPRAHSGPIHTTQPCHAHPRSDPGTNSRPPTVVPAPVHVRMGYATSYSLMELALQMVMVAYGLGPV
jgi:hypothetical protein